MNISEIKEKILISDFLKQEGFTPVRKSGNELFYHSPYRNDQNPSFTVNDAKGFWYDHGDARGGSIIDLAMILYKTQNLNEVLDRLRSFSGQNTGLVSTEKSWVYSGPERQKRHEIARIKPLGHNMAITSYLQERGVYDQAVESGRVREVYYDFIGEDGQRKRYFGAGWQNESGGYDIRSKYGKICIAKKDILIMNGGGTGKLNIFEGVINFLTALKEKQVSLKDTNIVLNTLSLYRKGIDYVKNNQPEETNLFLDNGKGGDKFTRLFQEAIPDLKDKRHLYADYGDYNDKLMAEADKKQNNGLNR
ncbi:MAG: CHC2 zinc finger domain-containing protein [Mangrovibacterium sp.]